MMPVYQNIPMSFSNYQRPCFESSPPEPWPYHGSHGYPYPYHPCCYNSGFNYFSGFQHPPFFTPHPMRCCGDHYLYPGMYNFCPPHHPMDHSREVGDDTEKSRSYPSYGHPMTPKQDMSYPYPILWVPPEVMRNNELKKPHADLVKEDEVSDEADHRPKAWDGCIPIDMNTLMPLLENNKEKSGRHEEGKRKFLFPNFWMPSSHEQTENPKGTHEKKISSEDDPYTIKLIPLNQSGKDGGENNLKSGEPQKKGSKNENIENSGGKGRRSLSPPKKSKPAPVCLRVDPLPRKRNQTRSSSPPASGHRENYGMLEERTGDLNTSKQVEQEREKIVKVVDVKKSDCREADKNYHSPSEFPTISKLEPQRVKINCMANDNKEGQKMVNDEMKSQGTAASITSVASMKKKKISSDEEAAKLIQSGYRGYAVRKWDPLKKLKQLSEVKKQVDDVKNRVKDLQSNHPVDDKEKIVMGELIMRLLLKLDTIQGLLPFVREVRKSLANELVMLQGLVDVISTIPSGQSTEEDVANCEEKSLEVMEVPMMGNGVDDGQHLVSDCPTESLGSDDAKSTSDEAATVFESNKSEGEAGVMADVLIVERETELEGNSCEGAGKDTMTVDANGLGESVPMTSEPDEEREATTEEGFSEKFTPTVVDAVINYEEQELEVGVIESSTSDGRKQRVDAVQEQNHPDNDFLLVCNESVSDEVINGHLGSAENNEIVSKAKRAEVSELVESEPVLLADVLSEVITTSEDHQLAQPEAEVVEEERTVTLHDEFQVEENKEAKELTNEEEEAGISIGHFLPKSERTEEESAGEQEEGSGKKVKENEQLREVMEKLMELGKEQMILISNLSGRVKELEKELKKKKKKRTPRSKLLPNRVTLLCK